MSIVTELKQQLSEYQAAEVTARALQDISALKMQSIRGAFEKNRAFFQEIRELYGVVQAQAKKFQYAQVASQKSKRVRQLYVAVTSNKRFYGSLIRDIIDTLTKELAEVPEASCIIIGRVGWQYFEAQGNSKRARQIALADDVPTQEEFHMLLGQFENFDRIFVLYPKFVNSFRQIAAMEDITQTPPELQAPQSKQPEVSAPEDRYIFEPEVPAMLSFFNTQVRQILFDRVLLEAELSRVAARLMRMGEAGERARSLVAATETKERREVAALSNMELLETFAGFTQWHQT